MPIADQRDPELTRRQLQHWLRPRLRATDEVLIAPFDAPAATGFSSETLVVDAAWTAADGPRHRALVVRVAPTGHQVFLDPDFEQQYRVQQALATHTDIPVPAVHWYEPDPTLLGAPFYVMDRVEGRVAPDNPPYHQSGWLVDATPEERRTVWWGGIDVIARLHRLDWRAAGLGFLDRPERGPAGLAQNLHYYRDYLAWVERDEPVPVAHRAWDWLQAHLPGPEPLVFSWGDARIGNILFDDQLRPAAVLDWEMVGLGAPAQDVAWALFLDRHHSEGIGVPRLAGFPSVAETVARYQERTGQVLANLEFYEVFAGFRFTVIMARLGVIFKRWGLLPADDPFPQDNTASRLTERLLGVDSAV